MDCGRDHENAAGLAEECANDNARHAKFTEHAAETGIPVHLLHNLYSHLVSGQGRLSEADAIRAVYRVAYLGWRPCVGQPHAVPDSAPADTDEKASSGSRRTRTVKPKAGVL